MENKIKLDNYELEILEQIEDVVKKLCELKEPNYYKETVGYAFGVNTLDQDTLFIALVYENKYDKRKTCLIDVAVPKVRFENAKYFTLYKLVKTYEEDYLIEAGPLERKDYI